MTHVIFDVCVRDGGGEVCPAECDGLGMPEDEWPWYYIDPETCIDCGALCARMPRGTQFDQKKICPKIRLTQLNSTHFISQKGTL